MHIKSVAVGVGPVPSFVVLEQRDADKPAANGGAEADGASSPVGEKPARPRRIPIRIGNIEASAISMGVKPKAGRRPMTHDLLKSTLEALGAELLSVRITKVSGTTFYAQLVLRDAAGNEVCVDARPSDAIALAVRCDVNVLADEDVIEAASMLDFEGVKEAEQAAEMAEFHEFVEHLSPDDFK